jgi:telomerase reverse transcriptase
MAKSLANFDVSINGTRIPRYGKGRFFPFCGNAIDVETLDITKDSTRSEGSSICPLPILTEFSHPGFAHHREIADAWESSSCQDPQVLSDVGISNNSALKIGGHVMFVDTKFNSLLTVFQNLYQVFSTTAIKLHHYLRAMEVRPQEKIVIGNDIMGENP